MRAIGYLFWATCLISLIAALWVGTVALHDLADALDIDPAMAWRSFYGDLAVTAAWSLATVITGYIGRALVH